MSKKKIMVIIPIAHKDAQKILKKAKEEVDSVLTFDFDVSYISLSRRASHFIESRFDAFWDTDSIIRHSLDAAEKGYNGIFIDCFGEPGVDVVRELIDIPIVGGFKPSVATAMLIAQKFSIVTVVRNVIPLINTMARDMGIENNLVSVVDIGVPVPDLDNEKLVIAKIFEQSLKEIREHGAEAIILGCTAMLGVVNTVTAMLKDEFKENIPVIAPTKSAIGALQSLIKSDLYHSRLTYYRPPDFDGKYPPHFDNN